MRTQKRVYDMTDRELRTYKRKLRRQREFRRKLMITIMTVCLILACTVSYHAIQTNASAADDAVNFKYYTKVTVQYGETLWDIADEYIDYNEYDEKSDYIAEVCSINHLNNEDAIRAGQHLIVPYYSYEFVN